MRIHHDWVTLARQPNPEIVGVDRHRADRLDPASRGLNVDRDRNRPHHPGNAEITGDDHVSWPAGEDG